MLVESRFRIREQKRKTGAVRENDGNRPVKGGEKVYHCGGGIVYHRHDEKGLNWEPGGIRSGAGVRSSGVSQESRRSHPGDGVGGPSDRVRP